MLAAGNGKRNLRNAILDLSSFLIKQMHIHIISTHPKPLCKSISKSMLVFYAPIFKYRAIVAKKHAEASAMAQQVNGERRSIHYVEPDLWTSSSFWMVATQHHDIKVTDPSSS